MQKESTYDLLKRWLSGDVGYTDEQQLNNHAASDPFLADALEGYESLPEADHEQRINTLKARLQENPRSRKRGVYWMRIAASVLIMVVAAVAFWIVNRAPKEQMSQNEVAKEIVQNKEEKETIAEFEAPSSDAPETIEKEETTPAYIENTTPSAKPSNSSRQQKLNVADDTLLDNVSPKEPIAMVEEEVFVEDEGEVNNISKDKTEVLLPKESVPQVADYAYDAVDLKQDTESVAPAPSPNQAIITGKVVDANNAEPLIGASILINGTKQGAVTDLEGNFVLPVQEDTNSIDLLVSYTGYEQKLVEAKSGEEIEVWMDDAGVTLSEVAVTSRSSPRLSKKQKAVEVAPKKGFDKYANYIKDNLNYPQAAKDAGITGQVVLTFYIGENNRPDDIKITKSLGYGCDAEAIRLLKEGPKWNGKGEQGQYIIHFER